MASFFGSGPLPDWKEVRQWLGKELPWKLVEQWEKADDGEWLDRFVKGLLNQSKEQEAEREADREADRGGDREVDWKSDRKSDRKTDTKALVRMDTVKESKRLTVTVQVPPDTRMRNLQLFATSDLLRVSGLPDNRIHTVRFPCRVFPRSGRAVQESGRILVKFRRRPVDQNEVELFIRT